MRERATIAKSTPIDAALDGLLARRGWVLVERSPAGDVYDWIDSTASPDHEPTYMIVAADQVADALPPYRVRLADGQRLTYDSVSCLAADLERIEAHRCCPC
jgi:hypothetical protein